MKKRINVADKHFAILREEFKVSNQSILNALKYFTESELAEKIRARAKELLEQEAEEVIITIED